MTTACPRCPADSAQGAGGAGARVAATLQTVGGGALGSVWWRVAFSEALPSCSQGALRAPTART